LRIGGIGAIIQESIPSGASTPKARRKPSAPQNAPETARDKGMSELNFVAVVSGLPRSGTSMMMQILASGGLPTLTDGIREADISNPKGYFEFERVKQLKSDSSWLNSARGQVVKVIHLLLYDLPPKHQYRVIFMRRNLAEIIASQNAMLEHSRRSPVAGDDGAVARVFEKQLREVLRWCREQSNFRVLEMDYNRLVEAPHEQLRGLPAFLDADLDLDAMAAVVEASLYRNRVR
jgi:hypothetical protein